MARWAIWVPNAAFSGGRKMTVRNVRSRSMPLVVVPITMPTATTVVRIAGRTIVTIFPVLSRLTMLAIRPVFVHALARLVAALQGSPLDRRCREG